MSTATLPPTRIVSSTVVSRSDARTLLAAFVQHADAERHTSARGDLVLSDQRRIVSALQGVFIPKPIETFDTDKRDEVKGRATGVTPDVRTEEEEEGVEVGNWATAQSGGNEVEAPVLEGEETDSVKKEKRKADKKARMKEEKKRRAEERAKEKR
jgi:hypothetical protein